tara:strand:+ start:181 stop:306 length:126 start_codon:yes stop_codon:yes gene_type:complete
MITAGIIRATLLVLDGCNTLPLAAAVDPLPVASASQMRLPG